MCWNDSRMKNWSFVFKPAWCIGTTHDADARDGLWVNQDRKFIITVKCKQSFSYISGPLFLKSQATLFSCDVHSML